MAHVTCQHGTQKNWPFRALAPVPRTRYGLTMKKPPGYLSPKQASAHLAERGVHVHETTIRRWITWTDPNTGEFRPKLASRLMPGGRRLIAIFTLDALVEGDSESD
jgi:hypothetical protein